LGANLPNRFGFNRSYVLDATGGSNYDTKHYLPGYDDVKWFEDGTRTSLPDDFYSSRSLVDKMIEYIDGGAREQPFFAFLSLQAVHIPIQAPLSYIEAYDGVFDAGWDVKRKERLERALEIGLVPPTTQLAPVPETHRAWDELTPDERAMAARKMQVNAGMLEAADHHIGRLLEHLADAGELEDTIVIVTSDNGAEAGETDFKSACQDTLLDAVKLIEGFDTSYENLGLRDSLAAIGPEWASVSSAPFDLYKFYGSEGGLRVPLIVTGPGIAASGIVDAPIHVADLVPTVLTAAGVTYDPSDFYGRSALGVLSGESETSYSEEESFGFEVSGNAALYRGKWKITRLFPPVGDGVWRLYDLSVDPGETTDLAKEHPDLFEEMVAEYAQYSKAVGVFELTTEEYAMKQLFKNIAKKSVKKYWPYGLGFLVLLVGVIVLLFLLARSMVSRRSEA